MEREAVSARRWVHDWLEMLDRQTPGWSTSYDREAFELAAEDVFSAGAPALSEDELEALGGFVVRGEEDLDLGPAWRRGMIEFEYIFRASHGSSRSDASLRVTRAETLRRIVDAARDPVARRLERVAHALEMREKRRAKRERRLSDVLGDERQVPPECAAQAREAAWRTSLRAARDLSPSALAALRRFLGDVQGRPACDVAREAGVSPATMTRSLRRLGEIAVEELEGCPDGAVRPFTSSLVEFLGGAP
jgi:hypothetical protein